MSKKNIGIDIDGVIADSVGEFLPYLNKMFNKNFKYEDINSYRFEELYDASEKDIMKFMEMFTEENKWMDIKPFSDAKNSMVELQKFFNVFVITSRPESLIKETTIEWLKSNKIPYDDLFFMDGESKYLTAKKFGINLSYFVEDCLELAKPIAEYIPVFMIKTPYNSSNTINNLIYVDNLTDVVNYFKK